MADDLLALHSRAQKALELANAIQKSADEAAVTALRSLQQTQAFHASLQQVQILLKDHVKDASNMVALITAKQAMARDVAQLHSQHFTILEEYQMALTLIQSYQLPKGLTQYVPTDIPKENLTYTLADWANVAELTKVEEEAVQELQELEKLRDWVSATIEKTKTKFSSISDVCNKTLEALLIDHRVPDEAVKMKVTAEAKRTIHETVLDITQHADRLTFTAKISPTQKPTASDLVGSNSSTVGVFGPDLLFQPVVFQQYSQSLPDKITKLNAELKRIVTIKADIEAKETAFKTLVTQCQDTSTLVVGFGNECQGIHREMTTLEEDFHAYRARPEQESLFHILNSSTVAWKQFATAFEEMVREIARRKAETSRQETMVQQLQNELNLAAEREEKERKRFQDQHLGAFPQNWPLVTLLQEPAPHYTIVPSLDPTPLPDVGGATPATSLPASEFEQMHLSDLPSSYILASQDAIERVLNSGLESTIRSAASASATAPVPVRAQMHDSSMLYEDGPH